MEDDIRVATRAESSEAARATAAPVASAPLTPSVQSHPRFDPPVVEDRTFDTLFRRMYVFLVAAVRWECGADAAEDLVQQLFIDLMNHRADAGMGWDDPRIGNRLLHMLEMRIANASTKQRRIEARMARYASYLRTRGFRIRRPDAALTEDEIRSTVEQTLRGMPDQQRRVFVLMHYEHRVANEVAAMLSVSAATVRQHLFLACKMVAQALRARGYEPPLAPRLRHRKEAP